MTKTAKPADIRGFTMIEVMTVIALVSIVVLGIGVLLGNSQQTLQRQRGRVYSDTATDSIAVQKAFDAVCRKASLRKAVLGEDGDWLELYYWDPASTASTPENYARFYQADNEVFVEHGKLAAGTWQPDAEAPISTIELARHVASLEFTAEGSSLQMFLTYEDAGLMPVVCSSVRHND
jgi:prepilin-type N-terminal cleavage/methylation domain-containing protein